MGVGERDKSPTAPQFAHGRVEPPDLSGIWTLETLPPGCTESEPNSQGSERNLASACEAIPRWEGEPEWGTVAASSRKGCPRLVCLPVH